MKILINKIRNNSSVWLSYIISCCCVLIFFIYMCVSGPNIIRHIGESDDYILLAIALERNFSDKITPDVIEQAKNDYPDLSWELGVGKGYHLPITIDGISYSWYFVTYPLLCWPMKLILNFLGIHHIFSFYLTNLLLLLGSVFYSLKWMKEEICCKILYAPLLLLSVNLPYLFWPSNEICLMSFMILACSALFSRRYALSAFFTGVSATLNVACFLFFPFVYLIFFYRDTHFLSLKINVLRQCIINVCADYKKMILIILGSMVGFIPITINLLRWNRIAVMQGMGAIEGIFERFLAYLLDLNFGILPYYPLVLFIFIALLLVAKKEYFFYFLTICGIMLTFSLMRHINCGMAFMSRYLSWTMPLILIGVLYYSHKYIHNFYLLKAVKYFISLSVLYSIIVSINYIAKFQCDGSVFHSIPKRILSYCPALYNPLFSTFDSRVNHIDGGYAFYNRLPVEYFDKNGNLKKVLLKTEQIENYLLNEIRYDPKLSKDIERERKKSDDIEKVYQYLNFPHGVLKVLPPLPNNVMVYPHLNPQDRKYLGKGWSASEPWGTWTDSKEAVIELYFNTEKPKKIFLDIAHVCLYKRMQPVEFYLDNHFLGVYELTDQQAELYLDLSSIELFDFAELRIKILNAKPKSVGNDPRELGIGLKGIMLIS